MGYPMSKTSNAIFFSEMIIEYILTLLDKMFADKMPKISDDTENSVRRKITSVYNFVRRNIMSVKIQNIARAIKTCQNNIKLI